jgi:hypothetical protein
MSLVPMFRFLVIDAVTPFLKAEYSFAACGIFAIVTD